MELDARALNGMDMTLRPPNEVQLLSSDTSPPVPSTVVLPVAQSDSVAPLPIDRLPMYTLTHGQVMTDEQLETLRRQISAYATICQQLVEMHKAVMAQQSAIPGLRTGQSVPYDPIMNSIGHKLTSRQRWTPSQTQLQILEGLFEQGNGTPNKQRIKEITTELSQHGQISETNVYNWFQNRRARTKRKQQLGAPNNGESEVDTDADSPKEKKVKIERDCYYDSVCIGQADMNIQTTEGAPMIGQTNEHHQFDGHKRLQSANLQAQVDVNSSVATNKIIAMDEQTYASGRFWDSQGQMVQDDGASEPLNLLHAGEAYSFAELGKVVAVGATASEGMIVHSLQQSGLPREGVLCGSFP
eukprot:c25757_g3_i2 orf=575-1642(-)